MEDSEELEIFFLISSLRHGGANRDAVDLANALVKRDFSVHLWTILDDNPLQSALNEAVSFDSLSVNGKWDLLSVLPLLKTVRDISPDVIHSFVFYDNLMARLASLASPESKVVNGVLSVPNQPARSRRLVDLLTSSLVDRYVPNSKAGAAYTKGIGVSEEDMTVIPNGCRISYYANGQHGDEVRDEFGIGDDQFLIINIGRLHESKGQMDLLRAFDNVHDSYPETSLLIIGEGPLRYELESFVSHNGLDESVLLPGTCDDIPNVLDSSDLFVLSSRYEGLPNVLLEAMAAGVPVIGTRVGGVPQVVTDGEFGVLTKPNRPDELTEAIIDLVERPEFRGTIADNGQQKIESHFSFETMVNEYLKLYRNLTG